eukprot:524753-Prorocentrum_minimum.AAC.1
MPPPTYASSYDDLSEPRARPVLFAFHVGLSASPAGVARVARAEGAVCLAVVQGQMQQPPQQTQPMQQQGMVRAHPPHTRLSHPPLTPTPAPRTR